MKKSDKHVMIPYSRFSALLRKFQLLGNVTDVVRGKLLKSKIVYRSYPTGSISGTINDSTFTFGIFGSLKISGYSRSRGYMPRTIIVDPKEAVGNISLIEILS
jgi:OOP family OmpA-OmpF porin